MATDNAAVLSAVLVKQSPEMHNLSPEWKAETDLRRGSGQNSEVKWSSEAMCSLEHIKGRVCHMAAVGGTLGEVRIMPELTVEEARRGEDTAQKILVLQVGQVHFEVVHANLFSLHDAGETVGPNFSAWASDGQSRSEHCWNLRRQIASFIEVKRVPPGRSTRADAGASGCEARIIRQ